MSLSCTTDKMVDGLVAFAERGMVLSDFRPLCCRQQPDFMQAAQPAYGSTALDTYRVASDAGGTALAPATPRLGLQIGSNCGYRAAQTRCDGALCWSAAAVSARAAQSRDEPSQQTNRGTATGDWQSFEHQAPVMQPTPRSTAHLSGPCMGHHLRTLRRDMGGLYGEEGSGDGGGGGARCVIGHTRSCISLNSSASLHSVHSTGEFGRGHSTERSKARAMTSRRSKCSF
jgi:hypothetical protein